MDSVHQGRYKIHEMDRFHGPLQASQNAGLLLTGFAIPGSISASTRSSMNRHFFPSSSCSCKSSDGDKISPPRPSAKTTYMNREYDSAKEADLCSRSPYVTSSGQRKNGQRDEQIFPAIRIIIPLSHQQATGPKEVYSVCVLSSRIGGFERWKGEGKKTRSYQSMCHQSPWTTRSN